MLILTALFILLALALFWLSRRQLRSSGMPGGRVVYSDTHTWGPVEQPLYDAKLGLVGRPDYLVEKGEQLIPVEVKSGRVPEGPYDTHIYQLAAYCLLVERTFGRRPSHGLLHYTGRSGASRTFSIDYTPELEDSLLELLAEMRSSRKELPRSHESAARCRGCGYRSFCDQKLSN